MKKTLLFFSIIGLSAISFGQVTSGLVAKYSFNNGNANDEVGSNNGTVNGATLTADRFGNANMAYSFNGTNNYIDFGDKPEFQFGANDFSISLWVYYTVAQQGIIINKRGGATSSYNQYSIMVIGSPYSGGSSNKLWGFFSPSGSGYRATETGDQSGAWHHVVLNQRYSDSSSIYIDGQFIDSDLTAQNGQFNVAGFPLVAGYSSEQNGYFFNGKIDDIQIYNKALTSTEIDDLFNELNPTLASINKITLKQNILFISPNPTSSILNIEVKEQTQISITNVLGDIVLTQTINGLSKIDVSNLTSGVYFIQDSKSGQANKFIKE